MRACVAEFLGAFILVFFGAGSIMVDQVSGGALGTIGIAAIFGLTVTTVIYGLGPISGAHINPAVSIAFALDKSFPAKKLPEYIGVQLAGAALASFTLMALIPESTTTGETVPQGTNWAAFALEGIFTFFLMLVIISVSTGSKEQGLMAGLSIGGVVFLVAAMGGPLTGASMNPARSFGPALAAGDLSHLPIYFLAPIAGAALSIFVWKFLKPK